MHELQRMALFCDIEAFCQAFVPVYHRHLLLTGQCHRLRQPALGLSEMMTLLVSFPWSPYRTCNHYSLDSVVPPLRPYFPTCVRSSRFVELMPRALGPLCGSLHTRKGRCTGMAFIDSTPLAVCHHRRIAAPKVFAGWATRGKTSMGWCYGFQLHLLVHDAGERLALHLTPGHGDDRQPVPILALALCGQLCGDRGYISQPWHDVLCAHGLALLTKVRQTMKNRLRRLWDKLRLRKRPLLEPLNDQLKTISQIAHTRHRSVTGFMVNLRAGLIAYTYRPRKPSLGLRRTPTLPVLVV
jgi:hypothetical protein